MTSRPVRRRAAVSSRRRILAKAVVLASLALVVPQHPRAEAPGWAAAWSRSTSNPSGAVGFAWSSYPSTLTGDSSSQLAVHWRFSENASTLQGAYNPKGYSGSYQGSPSYQQAGGSTTADKSVRFDGNDYAVVNHHNDLSMNYNQSFSIEVVFKPAAFSGYPRLVSKMGLSQNPNPGGWELAVNASTQQPYCGRYAGNNGPVTTIGSGGQQLSTSAWTHMVCTYDGTNMRFYWNGVLTETKAASGDITGNNQNLYIGSLGGTTEYVNGWMDEVSIYWAALDARQVRSHYQAFLAGL